MDIDKRSLDVHKKHNGKLAITSKLPIETKEDLSIAYTHGVAAVCKEIADNPSSVYTHTIKANTVAVVTDGSAVLGLGNIGAEAALPVMEGKAILFKRFANIDSWPICVKTQNPQDIITLVKNIAPTFGAINLEDIKAPQCFEIEAALQDIGIPVMHDDQHGTAIVLLAGLLNAAKVVNKPFDSLRIVINGAGSAGMAIAKLLSCIDATQHCTPVKEVILCDTKGAIYDGRTENMNAYKEELAKLTNPRKIQGTLADALNDADVFIGVSAPGSLRPEMIKTMAERPIVFAMANPIPEIMPDEAKQAGAAVVGTGRSDFPNQVNNVLAYPGVFRGALDAHATKITPGMKIAAALALSQCVAEPTAEKIIPGPFDEGVAQQVARAVAEAAKKENVIRASSPLSQ